MTIYTVKRGDTLYSIAKKHATTVAMLANDNGISKDDILTVGQDLVIRKPELTYVVRSRDTLGGIAAMFGLTSKASAGRGACHSGRNNNTRPDQRDRICLSFYCRRQFACRASVFDLSWGFLLRYTGRGCKSCRY